MQNFPTIETKWFKEGEQNTYWQANISLTLIKLHYPDTLNIRVSAPFADEEIFRSVGVGEKVRYVGRIAIFEVLVNRIDFSDHTAYFTIYGFPTQGNSSNQGLFGGGGGGNFLNQ